MAAAHVHDSVLLTTIALNTFKLAKYVLVDTLPIVSLFTQGNSLATSKCN